MVAPDELVRAVSRVATDKTIPKPERLKVLQLAIAWAEVECPWKRLELHDIGGRRCLVTDVYARFYRIKGREWLIWVAEVTQPDGSTVVMSELSMPTREDPQN